MVPYCGDRLQAEEQVKIKYSSFELVQLNETAQITDVTARMASQFKWIKTVAINWWQLSSRQLEHPQSQENCWPWRMTVK